MLAIVTTWYRLILNTSYIKSIYEETGPFWLLPSTLIQGWISLWPLLYSNLKILGTPLIKIFLQWRTQIFISEDINLLIIPLSYGYKMVKNIFRQNLMQYMIRSHFNNKCVIKINKICTWYLSLDRLLH